MKSNLSDIGLSPEEERVLGVIIQRQTATSRDLQRETGLPKSTLFRVLSGLKESGIIIDELKRRSNAYRLSSPEALVNQIAKKRRQYRQMELNLQELLNSMGRGDKKDIAHAEVYYNLEQFRELTEQSLFAKEKTMYDFGNLETLESAIGKEFDEETYLRERIKNKIFLKILTVKSKATHFYKERDSRELREIRFIPPLERIDSYWKVYDDTVIVYSNPKEKFVIRVKSATITKLFRTMFEIMWNAVGNPSTGFLLR